MFLTAHTINPREQSQLLGVREGRGQPKGSSTPKRGVEASEKHLALERPSVGMKGKSSDPFRVTASQPDPSLHLLLTHPQTQR